MRILASDFYTFSTFVHHNRTHDLGEIGDFFLWTKNKLAYCVPSAVAGGRSKRRVGRQLMRISYR